MSAQVPQAGRPLIVGIDIGGTKTHMRAVVADALSEPSPPLDRVLASSRWRTRGWNDDARGLLDLLAQFVDRTTVVALAIGAHGCDDDSECAAFEAALRALTDIPLLVVNDAELMPLALGMPGQIGVVAGTGSIAVCRPCGQGMMSAGGWGWVVGDEGSAAGLVREAVRAVGRHLDAGGEEDEPLSLALLASMSVPAVPRLGSALAALGGAAAVGAHAEAVFAAAAAGSALARRVIEEGGRELARLVMHLDARGAAARDVVAGGSVIVAQPTLWAAFSGAVTLASAGRITPHLFTGSPVEGACRLAATLVRPPAGVHGPGSKTTALI
jgi:N-acetylglucosamine kinase-like BadF-type ATPase